MDASEALNYIDSMQWFGSKPGLDRIRELLEKLGDPQKRLQFVHIAGTNGKGSCAAMTASVLRKAGYRTGLYTSPYLQRFTERMQVNGRELGEEELIALVERVRPIAEAMADHPTEFEIMTAMAMLWFCEQACDVVVLEVGLGGRLDATNIIDRVACSIIMNIGLDHTAILGDTVEQIAAEKAGIVKPGCPVVLYQQKESVEAVVREICRERGSALQVADFSQLAPEFDSAEGQVFTYKGQPYAIPLLGAHQLRNAAVVLEAVEVLRRQGWRLPQDAVEHGLYAVSWPARFEIVHEEPTVVVDGGHNPQCAETVAENLLHYFPGQRRVLLLGVLRDKDYPELCRILDPAADAYVCVTPNSERALPAEELAELLRKTGKPVAVCGTIPDGVTEALREAGEAGMVCAVGSLYMAGPIRACFGLK